MKLNDEITEEEKDALMNGCASVAALFSAFLVLILVCLCCGCKSPQNISTVAHNDTTIIDRVKYDSIYLHDSTFVDRYVKGDTVYVEVKKWKTKYVERMKRDSVYIAVYDTIHKTEVVQVEKKLTWWENLRMWLGTVALLVLLALTILGIAGIYRK